MFLFNSLRDRLVGPPKKVRFGRPANETDPYQNNRSGRKKTAVERDKQGFQDVIGPLKDHAPLKVQPAGHSPNPSFVSLPSSRALDSSAAGPSALNATSPNGPTPESADAPASVVATQEQPCSSQPTVPVYTLSQVRSSLGEVISLIGSSDLKDDMKDLFKCCRLLRDLLDDLALSIESTSKYSYAISWMHRDVMDVMGFLNEWSRKHLAVRMAQRKDIHLQVQQFQDICARHLSAFIAIRQSESAVVTSQHFTELRIRLDEMRNQIQAPTNPGNVDQADANVLSEQVQRITGHTPDASYILKGNIRYRENVALRQGDSFDVYRGKFNDGQIVAIKVYREPLMNDGKGTDFVRRLMRQVQLWSSFSSPFILQCYGIGMQMTMALEDDTYDKFQFYLVSPYWRRGGALQYISKQRKVHAYVNILQYIRHVAYGVQYLHQRKPPCVHASIRGENVIIKDDDTACLNGFGLTKAFSVGKQIELTGKNFRCRWMAPELLNRDRPPLLPSCDIWSWAMTALELITGEEPYHKIESQWGVQDAIVKGQKPERSDYPTFDGYCPQPDLMWALLEKCWAMEAENRPTMDRVITELESIEKAQIEQQTAHVWE